jgi:hypothetical protein
VATIIQASPWTVKPIQEETNAIVAILVFVPLFFYRMVAWMIIITLLHSFSLPVFAGFFLINISIFYLLQEPIGEKSVPEILLDVHPDEEIRLGDESVKEVQAADKEDKQGETGAHVIKLFYGGNFQNFMILCYKHNIFSLIWSYDRKSHILATFSP